MNPHAILDTGIEHTYWTMRVSCTCLDGTTRIEALTRLDVVQRIQKCTAQYARDALFGSQPLHAACEAAFNAYLGATVPRTDLESIALRVLHALKVDYSINSLVWTDADRYASIHACVDLQMILLAGVTVTSAMIAELKRHMLNVWVSLQGHGHATCKIGESGKRTKESYAGWATRTFYPIRRTGCDGCTCEASSVVCSRCEEHSAYSYALVAAENVLRRGTVTVEPYILAWRALSALNRWIPAYALENALQTILVS